MATVPRYTEREIACRCFQAEAWEVELRYSNPESEADVPRGKGLAVFDLAELLALQHDPRAYGETLAARLFHAEPVRTLYLQAHTTVEAGGLALQLRLRIEPMHPRAARSALGTAHRPAKPRPRSRPR